MSGQRAKNKKVVSVPMEEDLLAAIEAFAKKKGWNRVEAIKFMCRKVLGILPKNSKD